MSNVLGLLLLVVYIAAVVGLAAAITWGVIKIFPTERTPKNPDKQDSPPPASPDGAGRLFRKSKRAAT